MIRSILCALAFSASALTPSAVHSAPAQTVSIKDSTKFAATLKEMGYSVDASTTDTGAPQLVAKIGGLETSILLLGCTKGKNCSHIFLSSSYADVVNPSDAWITEMNDNFDFLKVGRNPDKTLFFGTAHFVEGLPRSALKTILEIWDGDTSALAEKAREAKLVKE
jgi:hypothetical protein